MIRSLLLLSLAACTSSASDDSASGKDSSDDSGSAEAHAKNGLPVGTSSWSGRGEMNDFPFEFVVELTNEGGELAGVVTVTETSDSNLGFGTGIFSVTGTHEPGSGLVALAPEAWIQTPDLSAELIGYAGTYDPDANAIVGMTVDYASADANFLTGGPTTLNRDSGDGAPLDFGDLGKALPTGTRAFTGTQQCTSGVRETEGELSYDGAGALSGSITFGDYTLAEGPQTFAVTGVHNPSTGRITLVPGLYTVTTEHSLKTFFVEATYDPAADRFNGEGRISDGSCPDDYWQAAF